MRAMEPSCKYLVRKPKAVAAAQQQQQQQPTGSLGGSAEPDGAEPQKSTDHGNPQESAEHGNPQESDPKPMKEEVKVKVEPSDRERSRSPRLGRQGSDATTLVLGSSACYCSSSSGENQ